MTPEEINRIAGRMVHRATAARSFLLGIDGEIMALRILDAVKADPGAARKIEDLEDRRDRLERAITDYQTAERIIRACPIEEVK